MICCWNSASSAFSAPIFPPHLVFHLFLFTCCCKLLPLCYLFHCHHRLLHFLIGLSFSLIIVFVSYSPIYFIIFCYSSFLSSFYLLPCLSSSYTSSSFVNFYFYISSVISFVIVTSSYFQSFWSSSSPAPPPPPPLHCHFFLLPLFLLPLSLPPVLASFVIIVFYIVYRRFLLCLQCLHFLYLLFFH